MYTSIETTLTMYFMIGTFQASLSHDIMEKSKTHNIHYILRSVSRNTVAHKVWHMCSPVLVQLSSLTVVNPSPYPSLCTSDGDSPHMGHCWFLMDDALIQIIRLSLSPLVMSCAWCMCLPLCNTPCPGLCTYFCFHTVPGS